MTEPTGKKPFDGVRILDFTRYVAGPFEAPDAAAEFALVPGDYAIADRRPLRQPAGEVAQRRREGLDQAAPWSLNHASIRAQPSLAASAR